MTGAPSPAASARAAASASADTVRLIFFLARHRGSHFIRVLPTLVEDLLDVVGWPYDGVDQVVMDDVHETMLDPGKSDHPLAAIGVIAQTPRDVVANLNLHRGLAEVDIAVVAQFKAHHVPAAEGTACEHCGGPHCQDGGQVMITNKGTLHEDCVAAFGLCAGEGALRSAPRPIRA